MSGTVREQDSQNFSFTMSRHLYAYLDVISRCHSESLWISLQHSAGRFRQARCVPIRRILPSLLAGRWPVFLGHDPRASLAN